MTRSARTARDLAALLALIFLVGGGVSFVAHRIDVDAERKAAHDALMLLESEIRIAQQFVAPSSVPVSPSAPSTQDVQGALGFWRLASQAWAQGDYKAMKTLLDQGYQALRAGPLGLDLLKIAPSSLPLVPGSGLALLLSVVCIAAAIVSAILFAFLDASSYEFLVLSATSAQGADHAIATLDEKVRHVKKRQAWEAVGITVDSTSPKGPWTAAALLQR